MPPSLDGLHWTYEIFDIPPPFFLAKLAILYIVECPFYLNDDFLPLIDGIVTETHLYPMIGQSVDAILRDVGKFLFQLFSP